MSNQSEEKRVPMGWFLKWDAVNSPQADRINRLLWVAKHAHYVDVLVRINGKDQHFEADWLKNLEWQQ